MSIFGLQYLEDRPGLAGISVDDVRARLRAACDILPMSWILLGWSVDQSLAQACNEEAERVGARVLRWHPLLCGDNRLVPHPEWRVVGPGGEPIPGYRDMPEFTFMCPNRPAVREAVLEHLEGILRFDQYEGVFLDRIRYPSPAADPTGQLGCFCDACQRAAAAEGVDLEAARKYISGLAAVPSGASSLVRMLLDPTALPTGSEQAALRDFLDFRRRSITRFVGTVAHHVRGSGLVVGLDCLSPALTYMVGQDLEALDGCGDWIKVMTYGHALGPAGLPFELLGVVDWLRANEAFGTGPDAESQTLSWLSNVMGLPFPPTRTGLREEGFSSRALCLEAQRGRAAGVSTLLAGIELVEIQEIIHLDPAQIAADLRALHAGGADGLVLSWDLWYIPLERLELVHRIWIPDGSGGQ